MNLQGMRDTVGYQAGLLGVVALVASASLAVANLLTNEPIADAAARDLQASLSQVLPENFSDNELLKDTIALTDTNGKEVKVYRARKGGAVQGVIYQMSAVGYAGPVVLVMALDRDGTVLGVRITKHNETPGLGDKIEVAKSDWVLSFNGKSLTQPAPQRWAVKKDGGEFDQFTGATITPRAVVKAVKQGLEFFAAHRAELVGESKTATRETRQ